MVSKLFNFTSQYALVRWRLILMMHKGCFPSIFIKAIQKLDWLVDAYANVS